MYEVFSKKQRKKFQRLQIVHISEINFYFSSSFDLHMFIILKA